jgi:hypothetical protein
MKQFIAPLWTLKSAAKKCGKKVANREISLMKPPNLACKLLKENA